MCYFLRPQNIGEGKNKNLNVDEGRKKSKKMLEPKNVSLAYASCRECITVGAQGTKCPLVKQPFITALRDDLYGGGSTRQTRRTWLSNYFEEVVKRSMRDGKEQHLQYFIPSRFTGDDNLDVCSRCIQSITGFSQGTLTKIRGKILRGERDDICNIKAPKESTKERDLVTAWIEMFCQTMICYSPTEKRHEIGGGLNRKMMYDEFEKDWKAGVLTGIYSRSNFGRMA